MSKRKPKKKRSRSSSPPGPMSRLPRADVTWEGGALFRAAAEFYRAAPWRLVGDTPFELRFPGRAGPVYATVMGSGEMEYGLALYFSADALLELLLSEELTPGVPDAVALTFDREGEAPPHLRAARRRHRWPLAGPRAFPVPMRTLPPATVRDPDVEETALLVASLDAVRGFAARQGNALREEREATEELRVAGAGPEPMTVRVTWPAPLPYPDKAVESATVRDLDRLAEELGIAPTEVGEGGRTPLLPELLDRTDALPEGRAVLERLAWSFFRAKGPTYVTDDLEWEQAYARFREWATFFAPLPPDDSTLAERALAEADDLAPEEREERERFIHPRYGIWKVEKVEMGKGLTLSHVAEGGHYRVRERMGSYQIRKKQILFGPLFQVGEEEWILGTMGVFPSAKGAVPWKKMGGIPQASAALELEGALYGSDTEWVEELESRGEVKEVWDVLREDLGGEIYTWGYLERRIREERHPQLLAQSVMERVEWWTPQEMEVCAALLVRAWNVTTRPELGGRSPLQLRAEERGVGPLEERLLEEMVDEVLEGVVAEDFASPEEMQEAVRNRMRAWLNAPQKELGGRTPVEAMLAERHERGTMESWPGVEGIVQQLRLISG